MSKSNTLQIVKVEPNKIPEVVTIPYELEELQKIVGGWIEVLPLEEKVCIVTNEEGKINRLPLNRGLQDENGELWEVIAGTFFVVGDDYKTGEFVSLTDEQAQHYKEMFYYPETFYLMGNKVCSQKLPGEWMPGMTGDDI